MVTDIRVRSLYSICCGIVLAAIAFMTWLDHRGTTLTGLDTQFGLPLVGIGAGVVLLGLHDGFGQDKATVIAIAGFVASLFAFSFGQRVAWTGTTFWPAVAIGVGLTLAVIGLSGVFLPERMEYGMERSEAE